MLRHSHQTSSAESASRKRSCVRGGSCPSSSSAFFAAIYNGPWISTRVPSRSKKTALNSRDANRNSFEVPNRVCEMPKRAVKRARLGSALIQQEVLAPTPNHFFYVLARFLV